MAPALSVGVKWVQMPCWDEQVVETRLTQPSQSGSVCAAALEISMVMEGSWASWLGLSQQAEELPLTGQGQRAVWGWDWEWCWVDGLLQLLRSPVLCCRTSGLTDNVVTACTQAGTTVGDFTCCFRVVWQWSRDARRPRVRKRPTVTSFVYEVPSTRMWVCRS